MNAIVMTTIRPPNKVTHQWLEACRKSGWRLIVVGDAKTPENPWLTLAVENRHLCYMTLSDQADEWPELSDWINLNTYARKNFGYLEAILGGAEWIFDTDDDNAPQAGFTPLDVRLQGAQIRAERVASNGCFNAYSLFGTIGRWPRGYPLDRLHIVGARTGDEMEVDSPVRQYLCDGDTDVDAIQRLTFSAVPVTFSRCKPVFGPVLWCPINSQSCLWHKSAFELLYLPSRCTFRVCDMVRGMIATRRLWMKGWQVTFHPPAVVQERNEHDTFRDFCDEMPLYGAMWRSFKELSAVSDGTMSDCYWTLTRHGLVGTQEYSGVKFWEKAVHDALCSAGE